ncbi:hypothetical protein [Nocardia vulneris]|uniref:hypothetical protein n=1 Tax=Nocardia vulneris TaxID=1141657 RepID=UPI0012E0B3C7|nr:hypothetical protein [Nocardia vulneris]
MTPVWIPLVASGIGVLGTLTGGILTYFLGRGLFRFDQRNRLRDLQRTAIADVLARGSEYFSAMTTLMRRSAQDAIRHIAANDHERLTAHRSITEALDTSSSRVSYLSALQNAYLVIEDVPIARALNAYANGVSAIEALAARSVESLETGEVPDEAEVDNARDAFLAGTTALSETTRRQLRPEVRWHRGSDKSNGWPPAAEEPRNSEVSASGRPQAVGGQETPRLTEN